MRRGRLEMGKQPRVPPDPEAGEPEQGRRSHVQIQAAPD